MMDDQIPPGGASEEQALRGLLRGAVEGLEPSDGALERLRYAVPARRTLKRQVFVGAAAVALLAGTAIPAALHMTAAEVDPTEHSAMAGHGAQPGGKPGASPSDPHQNGSGIPPRSTRSAGGGPDAGGIGQPVPSLGGFPSGGVTVGPSGGAGASAGTGGTTAGPAAGGGPYPPAAAASVPGCGAEQLGVVGLARAPEADGKVYGSFKVTNVSARGCTVTGPDTVTAAAAAGTAPGQGSGVAVVGHTAGDPASGLLPDPSAEAPVLVLPPNTAYEVRFAWVPSGEACTAETPGTGASAKPPQEQGADAGTGSSGTTGSGETQTSGEPAKPAGVAVSHTPQTGSPTTRTTLPEACGGTLYRTGTIPVEPAKP
ncbi:hypothetical protein ACFWBN_03940 [Streptomyces sp. NPDC059989]|uniref:hypothetical protein n=1 Tax=Streptomyces sp. NPDC059989 TaxID=3347026 RepID=UPI0036D00652